VEIAEVYNREGATEVIRRSIADYRTRFGAPKRASPSCEICWLARNEPLIYGKV
jgi:hypothetical protein